MQAFAYRQNHILSRKDDILVSDCHENGERTSRAARSSTLQSNEGDFHTRGDI